MPCHDVVDGVGEARSDEEYIREFCAVGCSSRGAALQVRKIGDIFGSVVTLDKASGASVRLVSISTGPWHIRLQD
jgi:hypothetical protein